jgi:predicted dehydrogenase
MVRKHTGFELVGVVDPARDRLGEARSGFGVAGYEDYAAALTAAKPDLVVLASPTPFHADQAIAAMERGIDVFCDKPISVSLAETDRMLAVMRRTGRKLMVYQPHRAAAYAVAMRDLLSRVEIGDVYMIKRATCGYAPRDDWQAYKKYGGGMLNNYGSHLLDQLLHVTGDRPRRVAAHLRAIATRGDAEDVVKVVVETERGIILDVDINMAAAVRLPEWVVLGRYGQIEYQKAEKRFRITSLPPADVPKAPASEALAAEARKYPGGQAIPWREEFVPLDRYADIDFYVKAYEYFALDQPPFVPVEETRQLMWLLDECRRESATARI